MIRSKLQQFMIGRNGADQFSFATLLTGLLVSFLSSIFSSSILSFLSTLLMVYTIFRMFSRRLDKRRAENARFLSIFRTVKRKLSSTLAHMKDREHRYFRCPNCKQQMRVPRGKGRIQVTCRSCGVTFEEKS